MKKKCLIEFHDHILEKIDSFAHKGGLSRNAALNIIASTYLDSLASPLPTYIEENSRLRKLIIDVAMGRIQS
jgi:metal-responsive CopG/Arc/MetJ family transcriptional regulator